MRIVRAIGVGVVAAGLILVQGAGADTISVADPNDTAGRLDIRSVGHGHTRTGKAYLHPVRMHRAWANNVLEGRSDIALWFSTDREDRFAEYRASIDVNRDGELRACFHGYSEFSDGAGVGPCDWVPVRRPTARSVVVQIPRDALGNSYKWYAATSYRQPESIRCSRRWCYDEAPDGTGRGRIPHGP